MTTLVDTPVSSAATPASAVDDRSSLTDTWRDAMVFARRNIEHIRQIPEKLLDVTVQPLMFVLLFAFVFGGAVNVGGANYREYLLGGILIQSLTFGLVGPATSIATDLTEGVIDRFRSLPASRTAYLIGHYLAELAGMALSISILIGAGFLVGWRAHVGVLEIVEALLLLLTFSSAMIWVGTWVGMVVRTPDAVMGVAFVMVFPLTFVSNAFVPIDSMPDALRWLASINPVSVLVAAVRELFGNPTVATTKHIWTLDHPVVTAWLACVVVLGIAVPGALRRYRIRTAD
jgi:ABC transporter DrrB family efflux protein